MKVLPPILFVDLLLSLSESSLPIPVILDSLSGNSLTASHVNKINVLMQEGMDFSRALCCSIPKLKSYEKIISLSEETGDLVPVLKFVKHELENKDRLSQSLVAVSVYPAVAVISALLGSILLYAKALPVLMKLSAITSSVILNGIFLSISWLIGSFTIVSLICVYLIKRNQEQHQLYRNLSFLCNSGISVERALKLTLLNTHSKVTLAILDGIRSGKSFYESTVLANNRMNKDFLYVYTWLLAAEQTGETNHYFKLIAEFFDKQQKKAQDTVLRIMEPAITIIAGGYILILVLTILVPFFGTR